MAGDEGRITDDLQIKYDGEYESTVRREVNEVVSDVTNDGKVMNEAVLSELVVRLPEEAPVREVKRVDL